MIGAGAPADAADLAALAGRYGVETSYVSLTGEIRRASPEALGAVLRALGAPVDEGPVAGEPPLLEPVTVAWEGSPPVVPLAAAGDVECRLETEDGRTIEWRCAGGPVALPSDLPPGYHELTVRADGRTGGTRVIRAPATLHETEAREWGVFLPLHALRTAQDLGLSDWTGLAALAEWAGGMGAAVVGTLPLFAAFLDEPFDPSPYAPVSRLFWNELWLDLERSPEMSASAEARALLTDGELRRRASALASAPLVDYREAARIRRPLLDALSRAFEARGGEREEAFRRFLQTAPEARTYAAFRAVGERLRVPWHAWPERLRSGRLEPGDYEAGAARAHLYAQWLARGQSAEAARAALAKGAGLYLDLPLGVHPDGFDPWRFPGLFADGVSAGAPPDDFFAGGQDWGFPPLHPRGIREDRYRYVIAGLRTAFSRASVVRLDHVMALHRLFWIPRGFDATEGVYVRYRPEEWWAILCVESRRARTAVVGEDLGTVPPEVREAMDRRGARRMYVVPFEIERGDEPRLRPVSPRSVASVGTHDLLPFAGWWERLEEAGRSDLERALAGEEVETDPPADEGESPRARRALDRLHGWLARGPARLVVVQLEDLWLEDRPQNEPGTTQEERPNWRRRARLSFEEFRDREEVVGALAAVDAARRERGGG